MSKYEIPDDHEWADERESSTGDDQPPVIDVTDHTIRIDDNRDSHEYEYGLEWLISIEGGVVTGYYRGHYLEGRTQSDPMTSPAWEAVPAAIKAAIRTELRLSSDEQIPTDLPEFYGEQPAY